MGYADDAQSSAYIQIFPSKTRLLAETVHGC